MDARDMAAYLGYEQTNVATSDYVESGNIEIPSTDTSKDMVDNDTRDLEETQTSKRPYRSYFTQQSTASNVIETTFEVPDAEETLKLLRKPFQIKNPGYHVCKRSPDHNSISFMHCRHVLGLGKQYEALRRIMEERARLEFLRDCMFRIKSVSAFVQDLETLVQNEYRTFYAITHQCVNESPMTKLYCLNALCEDLRTHIGHWNSIKQRIHTSKWLQPMIGRLYIDVEHVRKALFTLYNSAIYWMEKLIIIGFQVFSHSNLAGLSQEVLWNITRGLEDFNNILNSLPKSRYKPCVIINSLQSDWCYRSSKSDPSLTNFPGFLANSAKAIPFSKILNIIASERSKYAALATHRFFTCNEEFMKILNSGKIPAYVWNDEVQSQNHSMTHGQDTSDYHTASGSLTSISGAVLRVGPIRAPDLSQKPAPLTDFASQEQHFANTFLFIVCSSTHLLRKSESHSKSKHKSSRSQSVNKSVSIQKPPVGQETPVLSRSDSKRKTVSWGDSDDGSIRTQLVNRYMDTLWKCFGKALEQRFHEPAWCSRKSPESGGLGSVVFCNATLIAVIRNMIEHVCLKDMFPVTSVSPMLGLARKFHTMSAMASWDTNMCEVLGSRLSDKCYPCPLAGGDYSTRTGMLLRDTYQPLFSILQEDLKDLSETGKDATVLVPKQDLDLYHTTSIVCRLMTNCQVAHNWCIHKSQAFLASWAVGNFLLVTQTDLKLLADETKKALYQSRIFSGKSISKPSQAEQQMIIYLEEITQQMSSADSQLQTLSGSSMKIFCENCEKMADENFKKSMPVGKAWKKKTAPELPTEHSLYIEHALEAILEPVVEGVSKLRQTAQLSAISMATTSLCESWKNFILKEKIKFSYIGAYQLGIDLNFVKRWLSEYISNSDVRQSILDLSVFRYLSGAVMVLKKQPYRKGGGRLFREPCSSEDLSCGDMEAVPRDNKNSDRSPDAETDIDNPTDESDIRYVQNIDDWLALRVQGGAKTWRFSLCLNTPATNQ
ncbi:uncharacterized protein LOC110466296 [Mizuhopecten yessoensis]|uniref:Coiled-coil protein 142 C-terminal domain-containing protein n=1 Tax=Mizuhopecten yessoensis TaxID=6573 RepID=A0A210PPP9_MIZYE|nr:uncharacterized protein LOC110466296 [Mizuhopecten yessoensis]OWF38447.1 hypothetical protein KP79_PYT17772 [Mizuhopecten yessoensis]